jgi:hypothetical protein
MVLWWDRVDALECPCGGRLNFVALILDNRARRTSSSTKSADIESLINEP